MSGNISFDKNGKAGQIQQNALKGGVKLEQIQDKKLQAIFQHVDNGDGILDEAEISKLLKALNTDDDDTISSKEAKEFIKQAKADGKLKDIKKEDIYKFLTEISQAAKNINKSHILSDDNGNKTIFIEYNDGTTETVSSEKKEITKTQDGVTTSQVYQNNQLVKEIKTDDQETTETEYAGDKEQTVLSETITSKTDNSKKTITYKEGKPETAQVKRGIVTENYTYEDGVEVLQSKVENEGIPTKEKTTTYTHNEDGTTTAISKELGRTTTSVIKGNEVVSSVAEEEGKTIETTVSDGITTTRTTNKADGSVIEVVSDGNAETTTKYNADGKRLEQTISKDGQTYEVKYDGKGNTYIVVQNGESPAAIAKKFGTSASTLLGMNKHNKDELGNRYFQVGSTIKVPGEIDADDKRITSRKSASAAKSDYVTSGAAAKEAAVNQQADARKNIKWTEKKYNTFEEIARELFRKEGVEKPSNLELSRRIKDLKKTNPDLVDGQLKGKQIIAGVDQKRYDEVVEKENARKAAEAEKQEAIVQKQSAQKIVDDLIKATKGINDVDTIKQLVTRIDNATELAEVNRLLQAKGYKADDLYSPIEKFIYEEANNSIVHTYNSSDYLEETVQKWISNGSLKGTDAVNAQARMASRVIFDAGDGFGTNVDKTKKGIRMIKAPTGKNPAEAQAVLKKVNQIVSRHATFYGLGSASKDLTDYLEGELWDSEIKYLKGIMAQQEALAGEEKAEAITDLVKEAVSGAGTDIEYLQQAIKAISSPEDMKAVEGKLKEYCQKKGIKPQIQGQSYLQAILYDECDTFLGISTDHKEIRKFNEMMIAQGAYTEEQAVKIRAEQAALEILDGGFSNIQDAVTQIKDPAVYTKMNELLKTKGYQGLDGYLTTKFSKQETKDLIKAELAANQLLSDKEAADVALRLIQNSNFNKQAKGFAAIRNGAQADSVDKALKAKGSSLEAVMKQFNTDKAKYKESAALWDRLTFVANFVGLGFGAITEDISDRYRANTDSSDNLYIESKTPINLSEEQKQVYQTTVEDFEERLNKLKTEYQEALDNEGIVSGAVNQFCSQWNIGTTRDDIEARIEHDTETLRLLKMASEGKLQKFVNGKAVNVSFEEVFNERQGAVITGNGAIRDVNGINQNVKFSTEKAINIAQEGNKIAAMDTAKEYITQSWEELNSAINSNNSKQLSTAIYSSLTKISQMSGRELSLDSFGYKLNNGVIVDKNGQAVSPAKLKELATQLKQGISDITQTLFGKSLPLNSSNDNVSNILDKGYESKLEQFKQEYRETMGQEPPEDLLDSYKSTIANGKMVVDIGVALGAVIAAPFTGGGTLAVFCAAAGATILTQGLEQATDANGWTNSEWTANLTDAAWNGALAAIGMKVGTLAEGAVKGEYVIATKVIAKNEKLIKAIAPSISPEKLKSASAIVARVEATFGEVSSDVLQDWVQQSCMNGEMSMEQSIMNLVMSVGGNTIGHTSGAVGDVKAIKHGKTSSGNVHGAKVGESQGAKVNEGNGAKVDEGNGAKVDEGNGAKVGEGEGAKVDGGNGAKVGEGEGAKVDGGNGAKVGEGNGAKVDGGNGAKVDEGQGAKVGEGEGAKVGEGEGAKVDGGNGAKVDEGQGAKVGGDNGSSKIKLLEDNGDKIKIEIDGKTVEISGLKKGGFNKISYSAQYFTNDINNATLRKMIIECYEDGGWVDAMLVSQIIDIDKAMSTINDAQLKQLINEGLEIRLRGESGGLDLFTVENILDAQNAFEARSAIIKSNDYKNKTALQRFNDYLKNDNISSNDLLNSPTDAIHGRQVQGLKADIKLENRLYGIRQYMKQHPNTKISNHMYSKYLEELEMIGVDKSIIDKCKHLDSEYGCKIMVSANLKEASDVMNYLEIEFNQWKTASGGQAKFPPIIDFSTVKSDWYDTGSAYGQSASGAYSEPGYNGSLAFPGMTEDGVAWAMRHEMTHTNDLNHGSNIPPQYDLNKIMPKKPRLDKNGNPVMRNGSPVMEPDIDKCMFVEEFKKAGISRDHIPYAYNNTNEFIAVAAEGDLSKCSPEFRQMLVDFGMPEWQLNMKPKKTVKTSADAVSKSERQALKNLEIDYATGEHSGISGFFNKIFGNSIREQGNFRYTPPRLEKIASKDLDISGIYIGNKVNVMGDMLEGRLPKGKAVIVAGDAKIRLADSWTLDLADPQIKKILDNLEEGRVLTVGRQGDIQCQPQRMGISGKHLEIRKVNGEIVLKDLSKTGSEILGTTGVSRGLQLANRMKNYVSSFTDVEIPQSMKKAWSKCKAEINDIANSLSMTGININTAAFKAKYHSIMNDLSAISAKASVKVKQQLRQLMDKIKEMFNSFGFSATTTASVYPTPGHAHINESVTTQHSSKIKQQADGPAPIHSIEAGVEASPMYAPAPAPTKAFVMSDSEAKYLVRYTKNPEATTEVFERLSERIKNGEVPSREMLEAVTKEVAEKFEDLKPIDLARDFSRGTVVLDGWDSIEPLFKKTEADALQKLEGSLGKRLDRFKEKRGLLSDSEIQAKQEAELKAKQEAELKAQQEAQLQAQKEAELKAKKEAELKAQREIQRLNQEKLEKFAEKYPEVVADNVFRDSDSAVKLIDLMEKYDIQMSYADFNSQQIYREISASGIHNEADMDKAFDMIKKRFHADVIAEESRVKTLKQQYNFSNYETITHSDNVIEQLQKRMADGEKITMDDIDVLIQDGMPDVREFNKIKKRIMDAPELQRGLNDNMHLDVYSNPKYSDFKHGIPNAMTILDNILADVKNGKEVSLELIQKHIDNVDNALRQNGGFVSTDSYWILQDVLRNHDILGPQCKNFVEDIIQGGF